MKTWRTILSYSRTGFSLCALWGVLGTMDLAAVSVSPALGATGVSTSQKVVFTFGFPMDESQTRVSFSTSTGTDLPVNVAWTFGYAVLTCTPIGSWPSGSRVDYSVVGVDILGDEDSGSGFFKTSGTPAGGGSGTNAITDFVIQSFHFYNQPDAAAPSLDPSAGYTFAGVVGLASNRTATAIALTPPTGVPLALTQSAFSPEKFFGSESMVDLTTFDGTYPAGSYAFYVEATSSNQTVAVSLSEPTQQPNAPHVANFAEAQQVNPTQPFTLNWDAFTGGAAADYISVEIGTSEFASPDPGKPGALTGVARSVVVPANTLQPSATYAGYLTFYHSTLTTNGTYATSSVRGTQTAFSLTTTDGTTPSGPVTLTNSVVLPDGSFRFEVRSSPGQGMDILMSTTLEPGSWSTVLTTNSMSGVIEFTAEPVAADQRRFYRIQPL